VGRGRVGRGTGGEGILGTESDQGWDGGEEGGREGGEKEKEGGREGRESGINLGPPNVWGKFTPMVYMIV
jgi:hypothetical protein